MLTDQPRFSPENESISIRLDRIQHQIKEAAEKGGRDVSSIVLVGVTKTVPVERIKEAVQCGVLHLGENKVQEAQKKRAELQTMPVTVMHHLVGHLQTNKAKKACELFQLIQSVDSPRLAAVLDRVAAELGKKVAVLLEIKLADEPTKT